ncbi:MAG TPA: Ig-like domain-containing protein [Longimicrobiales bacterium]|nr:Ig-like domain-containing protein [Longimicrobiales bacterium]
MTRRIYNMQPCMAQVTLNLVRERIPRERRRGPSALLALLLVACGGDVAAPSPPSVVVLPAVAFLVGAGRTVTLRATVGGGGPVTWTSATPNVATVDDSGLVTALATGTTTVTARSGGASADAQVEVWAPPQVERFEAGVSYLGRGGYVEYVPGELPLVISVPHGGALTPAEIPDRTSGTTVTDLNTVEMAQAVRDAFVERTGSAPHLIISHLKRTKLDPNREIVEAAQGNPYAENAWNEFQAYVDMAEGLVVEGFGAGLYLDLHGHGHEIDRVELGYLLPASTLDLGDAELDAGGYAAASSIRALAAASPLPFSRLLRGSESFGAMLAAQGVASVPSPAAPSPGTAEYFTGGYNTDRHGSRHGGTVSGIQVEVHRPGIRDTDENRRAFGAALARAVEAYMLAHLGFFAEPPS